MSSINFSIPITGSAGGGGGTSSGGYGSVQFAGFSAGTFSSDSSNFFWNNSTKSLGIGTSLLGTNRFVVSGAFAITGSITPYPSNTYSLGSSTNFWNTVYATKLTGSLTTLSDGTPYLRAGGNITITSSSNGSIVIAATMASNLLSGSGTTNYVSKWNSSSALTDSIIFDAGTGIGIGITQVGTNVLALNGRLAVTGTLYPGDDNAYDLGSPDKRWRTLYVANINGSLTGSNLTAGQVVVAGTGGVLSGSSQFFWDNASGNLGIGTNTPTSTLTVAGTISSTSVKATSLSGSLTKLLDGTSYLVAGSNIIITSGANGSITIASTASGSGTLSGSGITNFIPKWSSSTALTSSLIYDSGTGVGIGTTLVGSNVFSVSGSTVVTGSIQPGDNQIYDLGSTTKSWNNIYAVGISGSLTTLLDGTPYLQGGPGVQITTGSNGSILISITSFPGGGGYGGSGYVTASFTNVTSVTVTHNLGIDLYDIEIFDANRSKIIPKSATATSTTQADIKFGIPTSGYVVIGSDKTNIGSGSSGYLASWNSATTLTSSLIYGSATGVGVGTTIFGSDRLAVNGNTAITGSILPGVSATYNLGSSTKTWNNVYANSLSGSLTSLSDGTPYLRSGGNVTITTGSNGSIIISTSLTGYTTASFTNVTNVNISHNMGLDLYNIEIFDTNNNKIIPKSATATSKTSANITFGIPTSGYVIVGSPNSVGSQPIVTSIPGSFTGDGSNPSFTIPSGYSQNSVLVFVNGTYYHPVDDYTISGTSLTFTNIPTLGAKIRIRCLTLT